MANQGFPTAPPEVVTKNMTTYLDFARRYQHDAAFRREVDADAQSKLRQIGFVILPGTHVNIVTDTDQVIHVVMPPDPNVELSDEALAAVAGGSEGTFSTFVCAGTFACSCMASTVSTLGSASTQIPSLSGTDGP